MKTKHPEVEPLLLRAATVCEMLGISQATLYKWSAKDPDFPKPVRLTSRAVRWRTAEVQAWAAALLPDGEQEAA